MQSSACSCEAMWLKCLGFRLSWSATSQMENRSILGKDKYLQFLCVPPNYHSLLPIYYFTIQNACEASLVQVLFQRRVFDINANIDEIIAVYDFSISG